MAIVEVIDLADGFKLRLISDGETGSHYDVLNPSKGVHIGFYDNRIYDIIAAEARARQMAAELAYRLNERIADLEAIIIELGGVGALGA